MLFLSCLLYPTQSFTLKRPFAKLRLITTDADQLLATPDWSKSRVDISVSDIPNGFNALTGKTITTGVNGYWNSGIQALNSDVYTAEVGNDKTLSVFYLPVPANSQNLTFTISVKDNSGNYLTRSLKLEVQNVPLVGNKLTRNRLQVCFFLFIYGLPNIPLGPVYAGTK